MLDCCLTRIGLMTLALLGSIPMLSVAATAPGREQACRAAHSRAAPDTEGLCWLEKSSAAECARLSGKFWPPDSSCGFAPRAPAAAAEPQDSARQSADELMTMLEEVLGPASPEPVRSSVAQAKDSQCAGAQNPEDCRCSEAKINIDWVFSTDTSARQTYETAIRGGKSPIDAVITAQGHNPQAQASVARCRDWGAQYITSTYVLADMSAAWAYKEEQERRRAAAAAAESERERERNRNALTFRVKSLDQYAVELEFYSADSSRVWQGAYLNDSEFHSVTLNCNEGEKICYAAWRAGESGIYWGAGYKGRESCPNCCARCGSGIATHTLAPYTGPPVASGGGGGGVGLLGDLLDAAGAFAGALGNARQAAPAPPARVYVPPTYQPPGQAPGRGGAKVDCSLSRTC